MIAAAATARSLSLSLAEQASLEMSLKNYIKTTTYYKSHHKVRQ